MKFFPILFQLPGCIKTLCKFFLFGEKLAKLSTACFWKDTSRRDRRTGGWRNGMIGVKGVSCEDTQLSLKPSAREFGIECVCQIVILEAAMLYVTARPFSYRWYALHFFWCLHRLRCLRKKQKVVFYT